MSFALLLGLAWKSALCAGATLLVLRLLRSRSASELSQAAHLGLLATVLAPFAALVLPPVLLPPSLVAAVPASVEVMLAPGIHATAASSPLEAAAAVPEPLDFQRLALGLYAAPAALLLLALGAGVFRLRRLRSRARVLTDPAWLTALASAQQRCGFKHGAALLVSPDLSSPVSWGVLRPVMILDEETATRSGEAESVIAHELAHLARMDWAKLLLGGAATALFWFNPLVWALARRCHDLREEAADDAVLRGTVAPADYAALLVRCARRERSILLRANGVAPGRTSIAARVGRILDPSRRSGQARAAWTAGCCAAALLFAAPLGLTFAGDTGLAVVGAMDAETPRTSPAVPAPVRREQFSQPAPSRAAPPPTAAADLPEASESDPAPQLQPTPGLDEALVKAAGRGDGGTVDQLLGAGVSPNAASPGDGSPLIQAARTGRADMVRTLLARGADIDMAVSGDGNPLIAAAAAGRTDMVRMLLDEGADIEASIASDENALIQASARGREEVVRLLLARGADPNSQVGVRTPLRMARSRGHAEIERMLLEAGARP